MQNMESFVNTSRRDREKRGTIWVLYGTGNAEHGFVWVFPKAKCFLCEKNSYSCAKGENSKGGGQDRTLLGEVCASSPSFGRAKHEMQVRHKDVRRGP